MKVFEQGIVQDKGRLHLFFNDNSALAIGRIFRRTSMAMSCMGTATHQLVAYHGTGQAFFASADNDNSVLLYCQQLSLCCTRNVSNTTPRM